VAAFAGIALPALVYYTGWWGLVKYWLMPWLGYHFWMSAFTVVHHTAPHIPFKVSTSEHQSATLNMQAAVKQIWPVTLSCHHLLASLSSFALFCAGSRGVERRQGSARRHCALRVPRLVRGAGTGIVQGTGGEDATAAACWSATSEASCCHSCVLRVDFLTHDISWHVPHHVSTKIPWYNLRKATNSLRENWGQVSQLSCG
jgi:fatty acid desaturase